MQGILKSIEQQSWYTVEMTPFLSRITQGNDPDNGIMGFGYWGDLQAEEWGWLCCKGYGSDLVGIANYDYMKKTLTEKSPEAIQEEFYGGMGSHDWLRIKLSDEVAMTAAFEMFEAISEYPILDEATYDELTAVETAKEVKRFLDDEFVYLARQEGWSIFLDADGDLVMTSKQTGYVKGLLDENVEVHSEVAIDEQSLVQIISDDVRWLEKNATAFEQVAAEEAGQLPLISVPRFNWRGWLVDLLPRPFQAA